MNINTRVELIIEGKTIQMTKAQAIKLRDMLNAEYPIHQQTYPYWPRDYLWSPKDIVWGNVSNSGSSIASSKFVIS